MAARTGVIWRFRRSRGPSDLRLRLSSRLRRKLDVSDELNLDRPRRPRTLTRLAERRRTNLTVRCNRWNAKGQRLVLILGNQPDQPPIIPQDQAP